MANIYLGSTDLSSATLKIGSTDVSAAYLGSTEVYSTAFSPDSISGLQLWYDISDSNSYPGTGTTVYDLKQIRNASYRDASIVGTYSYDSTNKYIQKGGSSSDRITMSANSSHPLGSSNGMTVSIWVYIDAYFGTYSRIFRTGNTNNSNQFTLGRYNNGNNHAIYRGAISGTWQDTGVSTIFSTWTNFTMAVNNSNNFVLYRNGSSIYSGNLQSDGTVSSTYIFDILGTSNNEVTQGRFGAAYVYNKQLNSTEVTQLYNGTNRY